MNEDQNVYYLPRSFNSIDIWKNVTREQWEDPVWQLRNSIRTVEQLGKVIKLSDYQKSEIERTIRTLRKEGKEPMRITPYYATLMQLDPFHPIFFLLSLRVKIPDEKDPAALMWRNKE